MPALAPPSHPPAASCPCKWQARGWPHGRPRETRPYRAARFLLPLPWRERAGVRGEEGEGGNQGEGKTGPFSLRRPTFLRRHARANGKREGRRSGCSRGRPRETRPYRTGRFFLPLPLRERGGVRGFLGWSPYHCQPRRTETPWAGACPGCSACSASMFTTRDELNARRLPRR